MSVLDQLVEPVRPSVTKPEPPARLMDEGDWMDVLPYHADNDPNADHFLFWLWHRLKDDGLLALYFPHDQERSYPTMVKLMSAPVTRVILVVLKSEDGQVKDVVGFATWEPLQMGPATVGHAGFIFLKKYWQRHASLEAGKRIMRHWFTETEPKLDVAIGLIAATNTLANRYVQGLGWTRLGDLPGCQQYAGEQTDAIMWRMTRVEFERLV